MKSYIIFDIETTGIPDRNISPIEHWKFPHIVQIAWMFDNTEKSYIIKPDNYLINPDSTKIHGITTEYALLHGKPILNILQEFEEDCKNIKTLVSHNYKFDISILLASCYRYKFPVKTFLQKEAFCTMKYMTDICKLPGKFGYKYPRLEELYAFLFHKKPDCKMHDAMNDVRITKQCYDIIYEKYIYKK